MEGTCNFGSFPTNGPKNVVRWIPDLIEVHDWLVSPQAKGEESCRKRRRWKRF